MRIETNPDKQFAKELRKALKNNNGYCVTAMYKSEETKCICKQFREQEEGMCPCGLYIKYKEEGD